MGAKAPRVYVISKQDQLATLASPVRQEILDVLARLPDASVATLADALGRPADGLYYHLRALVRVGLVIPSRPRRGQARSHARYRTVAPELTAAYNASSPRIVGSINRTVASMLRLGVRDFRRALSLRDVPLSGPRRELWAARLTGWVDGAEIAEINRLFQEIARIVNTSVAAPGKRLFAVSYVLVPLNRRPRRQKALRNESAR